jgi:hypothetical protein
VWKAGKEISNKTNTLKSTEKCPNRRILVELCHHVICLKKTFGVVQSFLYYDETTIIEIVLNEITQHLLSDITELPIHSKDKSTEQFAAIVHC